MLFDPNFFMQKSMVGSLFWRLSMLMLSFICAKTHQTSAFSIRQQPWHRQRLNVRFRCRPKCLASLAFSGSIGCNYCSLPLPGFALHSSPRPASWIYEGILLTGTAGQGRKGKEKHGAKGRKWKEGRRRQEECMDPFQHLPRSLHDMTTNWTKTIIWIPT